MAYTSLPVGSTIVSGVITIPVGNVNISVGNLRLRVKAMGINNAGNTLVNDVAFTAGAMAYAPMAPIFDGDSLTAYGRDNSVRIVLDDSVNFIETGTGAYAGRYPNFAIAGDRIDQRLADIADVIAVNATNPPTINMTIVSFMCGINSIIQRTTIGYSATVAQIYDQYKAYFAALYAEGIYGIAYTLTSNRAGSSGDWAAIDADKLAFNNMVRAGFAAGELPGVLALVDLATDYRIGPDDAGLNTTYFTDGLHWYTAAGDLVVAMMEKEAYENIKNGIIGVVIEGEEEPVIETNRALSFAGIANQFAAPDVADPNLVTINSDFEIEIRVRLTAFASQYVFFIDEKFSIIYGYVANKFEVFHETNAFPRTQFSTSISDSDFHTIKMKVQGGFLTAEMDGVSQLSVATAVDVNCLSRIYLGGVDADAALLTGDIDYVTLKKNGVLVHAYSFNEPGASAPLNYGIDSISGANMTVPVEVTRIDL